MKKYEAIAEVAKKTGLSQVNVNNVINALSEVITNECIENGGEVYLPALGKFKRKINPAREGVNPLTKKPISIKETRTLAFKPTSAIKVTIQ